MDSRMIAVIGAFDENGVYGIGPHLPWEDEQGKSCIKYDMGRFLYVTKETAPQGKKNVLIAGRSTAEALQMRPLPGRRMIVISNTLNESAVNAGRCENEEVVIARDMSEAILKALAFEDCGNIFFMGGHKIWHRALTFQLCTHAFITVVQCDTVARSLYKGKVHRAPEMLQSETFIGMKSEPIPFSDYWGENEVGLEFRNYARS